MNTATLIYAYSATVGGWLIRHWPDSAPPLWSHAGIVIPADEATETPDMVWHATWPKGFHAEPLALFTHRYRATQMVRYAVAADAEAQRQWCKAREGRGYALGTVLGRMVGLRSSQRDEDQCIEIGEAFLEDMGLRRWRGDHHLITPNVSFNNLHGVKPCR